jgi:hypothetical protein
VPFFATPLVNKYWHSFRGPRHEKRSVRLLSLFVVSDIFGPFLFDFVITI